jgi:hypothetical protein
MEKLAVILGLVVISDVIFAVNVARYLRSPKGDAIRAEIIVSLKDTKSFSKVRKLRKFISSLI